MFPHDKFAAGFILRHDQKAPGDDSKSEIKIYKFAPVPRAMIDPIVIPVSEPLKVAVHRLTRL